MKSPSLHIVSSSGRRVTLRAYNFRAGRMGPHYMVREAIHIRSLGSLSVVSTLQLIPTPHQLHALQYSIHLQDETTIHHAPSRPIRPPRHRDSSPESVRRSSTYNVLRLRRRLHSTRLFRSLPERRVYDLLHGRSYAARGIQLLRSDPLRTAIQDLQVRRAHPRVCPERL